MRKIIRYILLSTFLLVALLLALLLELSPDVTEQSSTQIDNAETVNTLLQDVRFVFRKRYNSHTLDVSEMQANSLAGFIQRAKNQAAANISYDKRQFTISISYKIFDTLIDVFVNVHVVVNEGSGVDVDTVRVGALNLPGNWVLSMAELAANRYTKTKVASTAIESIDKIDLEGNILTLSLNPLDGLLRDIKNIETGTLDDNSQLLKIRVAHYLRMLDGMYVNASGVGTYSLNTLLVPLMIEAQAMSNLVGGSATLENEAVLLALSIYAGHRRFATIVGNLDFAIEKIPQARRKPSLANRQDLSQHFIFSAAIKLLSEQGISIAVGEFKELMDRGQGGSGYSFVDLAADMAGAQFAALAVSPETAERVQQIVISVNSENAFFPAIDNLEEGMSKNEFAIKYKQVDSKEYLAVVSMIDKRLHSLPLYY